MHQTWQPWSALTKRDSTRKCQNCNSIITCAILKENHRVLGKWFSEKRFLFACLFVVCLLFLFEFVLFLLFMCMLIFLFSVSVSVFILLLLSLLSFVLFTFQKDFMLTIPGFLMVRLYFTTERASNWMARHHYVAEHLLLLLLLFCCCCCWKYWYCWKYWCCCCFSSGYIN